MIGPSPTRLVVITGVSSGIGRALYCGFSRLEGFSVAGCGRRQEELDALRSECGGDIAVVDVSDDAAVRMWASRVISRHGGPPAIVIANAGIMPHAAKCEPWAIPADVFDEVLQVNTVGVANVARHFLPPMVAEQRGAIIGISSGSGRSTGAGKGAYSASKFAVEAYVKCIAHALPRPMVAVPLAPGTLRTPMNPDEPVPTAEEWAVDAVPFILDAAGRPEVNGASLSVPGYYSKAYLDSFIIRDGQPLVPEPRGAARFARGPLPTAGGVAWVGPAALAAAAAAAAVAFFSS